MIILNIPWTKQEQEEEKLILPAPAYPTFIEITVAEWNTIL